MDPDSGVGRNKSTPLDLGWSNRYNKSGREEKQSLEMDGRWEIIKKRVRVWLVWPLWGSFFYCILEKNVNFLHTIFSFTNFF